VLALCLMLNEGRRFIDYIESCTYTLIVPRQSRSSCTDVLYRVMNNA
jgi:hypothetical protein